MELDLRLEPVQALRGKRTLKFDMILKRYHHGVATCDLSRIAETVDRASEMLPDLSLEQSCPKRRLILRVVDDELLELLLNHDRDGNIRLDELTLEDGQLEIKDQEQ